MFVKDRKKIAGEDSIRDYIPAVLASFVAGILTPVVSTLCSIGITIYYYKKLIEEYNKVIDFDNRGF